MRKLLGYGPRQARIEGRPDRQPGPGEVQATMLFSPLTSTNAHRYARVPADGIYPITLSYTGSGRVTAVGEGVTTHAVGDLVYPNFYRVCGACAACREDRLFECVTLKPGQIQMMTHGDEESALQTDVVFPAWRMRRVPPGTDPENASLIGFASVSVHACKALDPTPGETVLVNGAGPIGWGCIQGLRHLGCRVIATEIDEARAALAERFGAEAVIDGHASDAADQVIAACGGNPARIIEATGTPDGAELAFEVAGRGAVISLVGASRKAIETMRIVVGGLRVLGIAGGSDFDETIDLISRGIIDITPSITHRFDFDHAVEALELKLTHPEAQLVGVRIGDW